MFTVVVGPVFHQPCIELMRIIGGIVWNHRHVRIHKHFVDDDIIGILVTVKYTVNDGNVFILSKKIYLRFAGT